ncbi:MAG: NAD-dependent epimerase/dehydratase family protein [Bacilli bacterium]|nr:NAD-dependent epimerase/dehydratase family protein [Bacilli bacterium]
MKKVMVTGATGHVGNVLIKELNKQGYQVYGLVLPFDRIDYIKNDCHIVYGNILDLAGLKYLFREMDYIIHTAGLIDIGSGNKKNLYNVNINGTLNVMKAALFSNVKRVVYTSSVHAIPEIKNDQTMTEIDYFDPKKVKGNYAKSKAIATQSAFDYAKDHNLDLVVVMLSGVIGAHDYKGSYMGEVVKSYLRSKLPVYIKGGYNFVDVKDVSKGIVLALENGIKHENYILSGYVKTIKKYLDLIAAYTHKKPIKKAINYYFILIMSKFAELYYIINKKKMLMSTYSIKVLRSNPNFSNQKAISQLGWQLRPFEETVKDVVDFIRSEYNL